MELFVWCFCLVLARGQFCNVFAIVRHAWHAQARQGRPCVRLDHGLVRPTCRGNPSHAVFLRSSDSLSLLGHAAAIGREVFLGGILGFGLGLFLVPVHVAGEFLTQEMGLAFANQVNPATGSTSSPLTRLLEYMAIAIFFAVDGHHVFLGILHASFVQHPLFSSLPSIPIARLVDGAAMAEEWGLMLAAPVALCLLVTTVVLGLLTRAAPQMNLYSIGFPLRLAAGLAAVVLLLPAWVAAVVSGFGHFAELAGHWI